MKDKKVSFTEAKAALVSLSLPLRSFRTSQRGLSLSLSFSLEKKETPKQKKRFHLSVCDSEPRKHTDRTTKKGAPETFHINNNTLSTQTTHNALSRHHFRIWWEKHEDDDDDDAQRGGCDERSFIRRRRRRPRRKRRRASFFTIIEKKK
jgi:hypothetical protein